MARDTLTFRASATGRLGDLIQDEGLTCQASLNLVSFVASELLNYREEGVELNPTILFCEDAGPIVGSFPGSVPHHVGQADLGPEGAKRILKECAPLAIGPWHIWIERTGPSKVRYGVFSYEALPTTPPLHEAISVVAHAFALIIRKLSKTTVEIAGSRGNAVSLVFSTSREETSADDSVALFCAMCCADVPEDVCEQFTAYMRQMLERVLTASHGTILVVCAPEERGSHGELNAGVELDPVLDFRSAFSDYRALSSAESILKLQSLEALLQGLVNSDGIVAFDQSGRVYAYRILYEGAGPTSGKSPPGGARRRAFEGLKSLKKGPLPAILFRSQDGLTLFTGKNNA